MALVLRMASSTLLLTCRQEIFVEWNQMQLFDVPAYGKKRSKNIELVENNKFGPYRLLERIAKGGVGHYLAGF